MPTQQLEADEPCYIISVAAKMAGVTARILRAYEQAGLLRPSRSQGNIRLYSPRDLERVRRVKTLTEEMGVNMAGVEVILRLLDQIQEMEETMVQLRTELERLRAPQLQKP